MNYLYTIFGCAKKRIDINTKTKLTNLVFVKRSETNYVQKISKKEN